MKPVSVANAFVVRVSPFSEYFDDVVSAGFEPPTIRDCTLFVSNWPGQVSTYDIGDGTQRWNRKHNDRIRINLNHSLIDRNAIRACTVR